MKHHTHTPGARQAERRSLLDRLNLLPRCHATCLGCVSVGDCDAREIGQASPLCYGWEPGGGTIRLLGKIGRR